MGIIYILVLIFLGGVIVLVVYITTLAANEKFILIKRYGTFLVVIVLTLVGTIRIPFRGRMRGLAPNSNSVTVIFESANASLYVFRVLYLLLALICVVKVIKLEKGPLVMRA